MDVLRLLDNSNIDLIATVWAIHDNLSLFSDVPVTSNLHPQVTFVLN